MKPITKLEDALSLPTRLPYKITTVEGEDGVIINQMEFKTLVPVDFVDEVILAFTDSNGEIWSIDYDEEGAYKYCFPIFQVG